ncbi:serine hydrolase domain-containing protein [Alicyclobacillus fodiniaquatilis]|uniref:Serine hydrolase domain-containing protein n=1 Tax=Alicyclobacillus fodiniaquatilis TaxID=1661150 RepID=A0ABW4JSS2_9BACL
MTRRLDIERIQGRISKLFDQYGIPSAAVGVLHDGKITDFTVGIKDLTTREPAKPDTIYQCGSMTKTWTALAFMQLVDEGKVDLDEPVQAYLPGFKVADPEVSATVTPRQLLNHTNGIEEEFDDPGEGDDVYERMIDNITDARQVHPLGHTHGYSAALGYAILARIMEVIDGKRWDDIMQDRLFDPMGLTSTYTWRPSGTQEQLATGHIIRSLEEGPLVSPIRYLPRSYGPGGNLGSTAREVLMMAHVFLAGGKTLQGTQILSAKTIREMMESRVPLPDPYMFGPEWALGLIACDWYGHTVYAHDGSTIGFNSRLRILPDYNLAIVMLSNGAPRDSFYRNVFNEILVDLGAVTIPDLPKPNTTIKLDFPRYEGIYGRPGVRYEIEAIRGKLYLTFVRDPFQAQVLNKPERTQYELLPISDTHFIMPPNEPLEDTQTVAIYDFKNGGARYLHTNCRVNPRIQG